MKSRNGLFKNQSGNALLIVMMIASVSGLLIWTINQTIENRQKERRLESGKSIRNEIWRSVSTYASDASLLRTLGQKIAAGAITGTGNTNLAQCLGYITTGTCTQTAATGVFDTSTKSFNATHEVSLAQEVPFGSGTLIYHTRAGSSPIYYSNRGDRDCTLSATCSLSARAGFFARCQNGAATCTVAESVTLVVQVKDNSSGLSDAQKKQLQYLNFSSYPSDGTLSGTFSNGWDKYARQLAVTDIRGDWGCPVGGFPSGLRQSSGAVTKSSGIPDCKCFWETYPPLSPTEKTTIRNTLVLNTNGHPIDCEAKLTTFLNAAQPLVCPATAPVFMGYTFVLNSGTGLMEPQIKCTTFSMVSSLVNSGTNQTTDCSTASGATAESRICNLTVSTCSKSATNVVTCSDAQVGCCTPQ